MEHSIRRHTISFKNAFAGIGLAFKTQPNFRVHCLLAIIAIIAGIWLELSTLEWALIVFTIIWVLLTEMINTAIESMVDLITTEYRQEAKIAKDVAAGSVVLGAFGSIIIAVLIYLPKLLERGMSL
jgi:undecaprenol kinase/diacylglycerol kinase (ATP)